MDIAFLAAVAVDPVARFDVQERLAVHLGRDVDLVRLRPTRGAAGDSGAGAS
ncbi:MAG: hypothetical protein HY270_01865 [Deltaproteobacteria bacterium]|nr:hypothetical protein [Deltaproteobacteria bacterium]